MFFNKRSNGREIAQGLIKNTGLDENLGILKQKNFSAGTGSAQYLELVMVLSACNLVQTMKADFIQGEFEPEVREDITREYILESLRRQDMVPLQGEKHLEIIRLGVMGVVAELQVFWKEEESDGSGPGPRYYCVKEVLRKLGGAVNFDLHDALFELMYLQHRHYLSFFREYMKKPA